MKIFSLFGVVALLDVIVSLAVDDHLENSDDGVSLEVKEEESVVLEERPVYKRPIPNGPTYFCEPFDTRAEFLKRWVPSKVLKNGGQMQLLKYDGQWSVDEPSDNPIINDLGLILKSKAKHHAISAKLDRPFEFTGNPLIVQYEVKFQSGMDCGGAYIKLLSQTGELNLKNFTDKTPYTIMFGPDKCGNDHKLHFIFRRKNATTGEFEEVHAEKPSVTLDDYFIDRKTHLYTLIVRPNNTYEIRIDKAVVANGSLYSNLSTPLHPPTEAGDPSDKKPEDWDDRERIPDPDARKPDDWDESEPATIVDVDAVMPDGWLEDEEVLIPDPASLKPDDWDSNKDGYWKPALIENPKCRNAPGCGKWERPSVPNPRYRGKWVPPMIENPDYKGEWKQTQIANPVYSENSNPYQMTPVEALGLELWSMTENIIFDNFIIADNATVVEEFTSITWDLKNIQEQSEFSTEGWWTAIRDTTAEQPWLWIVYAVMMFLFVLLCFICFCPSPAAKKKKVVDAQKKFDEPTPNVYDSIQEEDEDGYVEENERDKRADFGSGIGRRTATKAILPGSQNLR